MRPEQIYFSQHGEDRWIVENLRIPEKGVFIDVGAFDGVLMSNTLHFERRGWTGVAIEGDPRLWIILQSQRKCPIARCAIGTDPNAIFEMNNDMSLSGFGRGGIQAKVPVARLDTVLENAKVTHIDLLSIDTEGSELDVWSSFDHNKYQPRIVILEHDTVGRPSAEATIMRTFASLPYRCVHRTKGNLIFERTD